MSVSSSDRALIETYFKAMQLGRDGENDLLSIFADDGVYVEPFTGNGKPTPHAGIDAIRAFFRSSWENGMTDMTLTLHRIDVDGERLRSEWTCEAPVFPAPMHGHDLYTIRNGKIARLEVNFSPPPAPRS